MKLSEYLEAIEKFGFNVDHFCRCHNLCNQSIYKYRKGGIPRVFEAKKIEKATKGLVTLKDLGISQ